MTKLFILSLLSSAFITGSATAADASCKPIAEASAKLFSVPAHLYTSETGTSTGGKERSSELIYSNDTTYILVRGKWRVSPIKQSRMKEMRAQAIAASDTTCETTGNEAINGEAATIYSFHHQADEDKVDTRVWVSKTRGLPLKEETDTEAGGNQGKSHRTTRYEYTNVQAPSVQ